MPGSHLSRDRLVVCDCYTLFVGVVGPREGANAILVSLFLGAEPGGYLGLTTDSELERAKAMVLEHAERRQVTTVNRPAIDVPVLFDTVRGSVEEARIPRPPDPVPTPDPRSSGSASRTARIGRSSNSFARA